MEQIPTQKFVSKDGKIFLLCNNDASLGVLHDFLMEIKGITVELMNKAQKQEVEATKKVKDVEEKQKADKEKPVEEVPTVPIETK